MINKKIFFGAALGTMIEYYDYALFAILLPLLSPLFFPADSIYQSLVKGYFVMLIAMLARPVGGIFFGFLGDVLGRPKALLASMYGIAIATTIIGLTPGYISIGIWATVIVTIAKAVQIFCFGGEYNGAGIYVVEHANNKQEAFVGSLLTATTLFGSLIASCIGVIVTYEFMPSWSWRVAFILGGLIGIFGIFYRKKLLESPNFRQADIKREGLLPLIKLYPRELLAGVFIGGFATVPFTTVLVFINPVLMANGFFDNHQLMILQTILIFIAIATLIPTGLIADKYSPKQVMKFACLALTFLSYPLLVIIDKFNAFPTVANISLLSLLGIIGILSLLIIINELLLGPSNAYLKNLFAMQYRYRGASLSFCTGMSLLGGLTPVIESYIYQWTGQFAAISLWLIFIGGGSYLTIYLVDRKKLITIPQAQS